MNEPTEEPEPKEAMMKLTRVKSGLYRTHDDTVVKREGGQWALYRSRFDFFTGRKTGTEAPRFFCTLRDCRDYLRPLGPNRVAFGCYSRAVNRTR